jgi:dihydroorotase-like cyclic amidohydrolase
MDQDDRNASCYALTAEELQRLKDSNLRSAENAAASGNVAEVMAFCENVQKVLDAEHLAWLFARAQSIVPVAPKPSL